jgi:hypothetical protein
MDNVVMELPNEAIVRMTPPETPGRADHDCRKIVAQQGGATSSHATFTSAEKTDGD